MNGDGSSEIQGLPTETCYVCPRDRAPLRRERDSLVCIHCDTAYPFVRGIPILLNDETSVFRIADFTSGQEYHGASGYGGSVDRSRGFQAWYHAFATKIANPSIKFPHFTVEQALAYVQERIPTPKILVIGAGEVTYDVGDCIYTDVAFGKNVTCICDAHELPFPDGGFDLIIACAVLEHVVDPGRCVTEIARLLRPGGCVYAVTPFMQPVHMRAHDFTRFTYLGHRRLFRQFDDIASGTFAGPASSLATIIRYTILSMSRNRRVTAALRLLGLLITYPLRYLDLLLVRNPASYDAAFAVQFFGSKREKPIPDRDILALYRGGR